MKKILITFIVSILSFYSNSQVFKMNFYLENSDGEKDTLIFGFDETATGGIDKQFGEQNFISDINSISSIAFFCDAVSSDYFDPYLEFVKEPSFMSKTQIVGDNQNAIEIAILNESWPLTISWDSTLVQKLINEQFFEEEDYRLIMTGMHPPGGWFDAQGCGELWYENQPFIDLSTCSSVVLDETDLCIYENKNLENFSCLLYLGIDAGTSSRFEESFNHEFAVWYDKINDCFLVKSNIKHSDLKFSLYDLSGCKLFEDIICFEIQQGHINIPTHKIAQEHCVVVIIENNFDIYFKQKISIQ